MKFSMSILLGLFGCALLTAQAQKTHSFTAEVKIANTVQKDFKKDGRLYLFLCENTKVEPRTQTWPSPRGKCYIFAKNISDYSPKKTFTINNSSGWVSTHNSDLTKIPAKEYAVQVLWDHDTEESRITAPTNLYSKKRLLT